MTPAIIRRPQYDEQNPFPQQGQPLPQVPTMAPQLQMAPVDPHHAITAPLGPMPQPQPMGMDGQPKGEAQPKMSAQPKSDLDTQEQQMTAQRDKLEWEKHNPYGSANNHPGFMGKLLHGLSMAGNIAGNIFAPSTMALIPGTQLNRQVEEGHLNRGIQGIEKEKSEQTNQQSEEELREAQVRNLDSEVSERNQPADKKLTTIQTDQGWMSFDPATGAIAPLQADGKALQSPDKKAAPILHETDQGLMLVDPMTREVTPLTLNGKPLMPKAGKEENPKAELQRQLINAENSGDQPTVKKLKQQLKDLDPAAEQRFSFTVSEAGKHDARQETTANDRHAQAVSKQAKPFQDVIDKAQEAHEAAAENTGAGDYAVLMAFVDATKPSSGFRFTEAERRVVMGARSMTQDLEATYQKATTGRLFPDQQKAEMLRIIDRAAQHAQGRLDSMNGGHSGNAAPQGGGNDPLGVR